MQALPKIIKKQSKLKEKDNDSLEEQRFNSLNDFGNEKLTQIFVQSLENPLSQQEVMNSN